MKEKKNSPQSVGMAAKKTLTVGLYLKEVQHWLL
jgi:hypothetical protein